ncbi:MAG: sigma-70 family RNA polymerase sigma factor [Blastocatellia bacterium]|jgi:RNA polymerase sigma-70 factor (ECF subfamily)|nr:sigma-70 family RNA polymerase sigma factor [Blastocatellia bacterium]
MYQANVLQAQVAVKSAVNVEALSDHELVAAARDGDELAFQEVVRRYRTPITNFVYRMLNDYEMAVDLAQETFVRVYTSIGRYEANFSFSTYIYRIASNLAISEIRKRKRRRVVSFFSVFQSDDGEMLEHDPADTRQLAEDALLEDERRLAVTKAIATLPEKYRSALVLRDIEDHSYEQIAQILDLSEGTVKSRINRARNLLREKLEKFMAEAPHRD